LRQNKDVPKNTEMSLKMSLKKDVPKNTERSLKMSLIELGQS